MKSANELAMVVAFYLSKFGNEGLVRLGFETYKQAFQGVAGSLNVNPNSVKNWRDEFDPYYDNGRKGWYQRGIRPTRQKVMATFDSLSEDALRMIVLDILKPNSRLKVESELQSVLEEIKAADDKKTIKKKAEVKYIARGITGRMAEEFFISRFNAGLTPFTGSLKDCRDEGTGFDFEIVHRRNRTLVEIKGVANKLGSVTFTDKEWKVAGDAQDDYFLGVVIQLSSHPQIGYVQNPAHILVPAYYAYTTVTVNWAVSAEQIAKVRFS